MSPTVICYLHMIFDVFLLERHSVTFTKLFSDYKKSLAKTGS